MSVYKFAINGEEHEVQGSGGEVQSPLTAGVGIDITDDIVSNTGVLSFNGEGGVINFEETVYSGDENVDYEIRVRTDAPAAGTNSNVVTFRKVL